MAPCHATEALRRNLQLDERIIEMTARQGRGVAFSAPSRRDLVEYVLFETNSRRRARFLKIGSIVNGLAVCAGSRVLDVCWWDPILERGVTGIPLV